jgi:hypothetical protein
MPSLKNLTLLGLALSPVAVAHFVVNTPSSLSSNINDEDTSPCGGATPSSSNKGADFHVDGDAIGITTLHAQSFLAYRGMLGVSLSSPNWTVLVPTIEEFGLNGFCQPSMAVPASWAGSSGLLQIIQDAEDGVHYQVCHAELTLPNSPEQISDMPRSSVVHASELCLWQGHPAIILHQLLRRIGEFRIRQHSYIH